MLPASLAPSQSVVPLTETARRRRALRLAIRGTQLARLGAQNRADAWEAALTVSPDDPGTRRAHAQSVARVLEMSRRLRVFRRAARSLVIETVGTVGETVSAASNGDSQPAPTPPPVVAVQPVAHYGWFDGAGGDFS